MTMAEGGELTPDIKELKLDLQLLRDRDPNRADLYYHRELKERNRLRMEENRPISLEEKRIIFDAIAGMREEEVQAQIQLRDNERERSVFEKTEEAKIKRQEEQIQRMGGRTHADYVHEALEEKEALSDSD